MDQQQFETAIYYIQPDIANEFLTALLIDWRRELWPDLSTDPLFKENLDRGFRDWREVDLTPYKSRRILFASALFGLDSTSTEDKWIF